MRKLVALVVAAGALCAAVLAGATSASPLRPRAAEQETIKIGAMTILSGPTAIIGQETLRGTEFMAELINRRGGVLGRRIEIIEADDQNNPAVGIQQFARLVQQDRIVGLLGPTATAVGVAIQKLQSDYRIPAVAYQSGGEALTAAKSPWVFRSSVTLQNAFHAITRYASLINRHRRLASIHWDLASGQSAHEGIEVGARQFGARIVYEQGLPLLTADFSSAIAQAREWNPDAVLIGAPMPMAGVLTRQIRAAGWRVPLYVWGGFVGVDYGSFAGADANGVWMGDTSHWRRVIARKKGKEFVDAFVDAFRRPPLPNELLGADALGILVEGIRRARSTDGDRIQRAIHQMLYNGIRLYYRWRADGNLRSHPVVMTRWTNNGVTVQLVSSDIYRERRR